MRHFIDLTGKTFGRLKVIKRCVDKTYINGEILWECVCSCPKKTIVISCGSQLRRGDKKSCGCIWKPEKKEFLAKLQSRLIENSRLNVTTQCMEWIGFKNREGYGNISVTINGKEKPWGAHRAAWLVYNGDIPNDKLVCHKCDNPSCVNIYHLFLGTQKDNMIDKMRKGRHRTLKGNEHPCTKLRNKDVKYILSMKGKITSTELGKQFNMAASSIRAIWQRRNWKHI